MKNNTKIQKLNRFAALAKLGEIVFHIDDLANLWHITNKNTLYTTIKRYVEQKLLVRIYKGFYAIKPLSEIDPQFLGVKALHGYAYVSSETILRERGIIQQELPAITIISSQTKHFSIADNQYYSRKLPDQFLYQTDGITFSNNGVYHANLERAIADLLYFNPRAYFDAANLVDWKKVSALQAKLGYPLTPKYYD